MKTIIHLRLPALLGDLCLLLRPAPAQTTAFTYQGQLLTAGRLADGLYDLRLFVFDAPTNGTALAGPVTNTAVAVSNGLFTTLMDFGPGIFTGPDTWLHIGIRTNGTGPFTGLSPLQQLTPTPNAFFADTASNLLGTLPAARLSGTLLPAQLSGTYGGVVRFDNPANSFSGNGGGLTNLRAWQLSGNLGTVAGANFIGTADNQPLQFRANGQRILVLQPDSGTNGAPNLIAGSPLNLVAAGVVGATVGGGGASNYSSLVAPNQAFGSFNTIGGGVGNTTGTTNSNVFQSTVGGGAGNTASGISSTIAGGSQNVAYNNDAAIAGGFQNQAAYRSAVAGGEHNQAAGVYSAMGGGYCNAIDTNAGWATIAGGIQNSIGGGALGSVISGGYQNLIQTNGNYSFIGGGYQNVVEGGFEGGTFEGAIVGGQQNLISSNAYNSFIGGGYFNTISPYAQMSTIGGGYSNTVSGLGAVVGGGGYDGTTVAGNSALGTVSTIGGGMGNSIGNSAYGAVIAGGVRNAMGVVASYSTIGGGQSNVFDSFVTSSVIAGGLGNSISNSSYGSAIAGGQFNTIQANSPGSFISAGTGNSVATFNDAIGGGQSNLIQAASQDSVIAGGYGNQIAAPFASIGGGLQHTISSAAAGATIAGGEHNFVGGNLATVLGGYGNSATGPLSIAAGEFANASLAGSFVWNSFTSTATSFASGRFHVFGTNGFSVDYYTQRPDGGGTRWIEIGPQFAGQTISAWNGAYLSDAGIWQNASDRNRKTAFAAIDPRQVLDKLAALPIQSWRYTNEIDTIRHLGPTAQDFKASFGLGADDRSIGTLDEDGVALAAIQGLDQKLEEAQKMSEIRIQESDAKIEALRAENGRLREQNQALAQRLEELFRKVETLDRASESASSAVARIRHEDPSRPGISTGEDR